jgi:5-oxoprolinase (ATP-hydrolysing) subunit B
VAGSVPDGQLKLSFMGSSAILCESTGPLSLVTQTLFWALARLTTDWPSVKEVVPGMNNLLVILNDDIDEPWSIAEQIRAAWAHVAPMSVAGRIIEVPVVYGGASGLDLEFVARRASLQVEDAAALHASADYRVFFLGAHAGFGYLGGLDRRLHTPRLSKPRLNVSSGTVAIGGVQTGVIAQTSPSGWQLIGRTDTVFFDVNARPPALLAPGDTVKFRIVSIET